MEKNLHVSSFVLVSPQQQGDGVFVFELVFGWGKSVRCLLVRNESVRHRKESTPSLALNSLFLLYDSYESRITK